MMTPFGEIRANFVDVYLIFSLITWEHQRIIKIQLSKSKDQKKKNNLMTPHHDGVIFYSENHEQWNWMIDYYESAWRQMQIRSIWKSIWFSCKTSGEIIPSSSQTRGSKNCWLSFSIKFYASHIIIGDGDWSRLVARIEFVFTNWNRRNRINKEIEKEE